MNTAISVYPVSRRNHTSYRSLPGAPGRRERLAAIREAQRKAACSRRRRLVLACVLLFIVMSVTLSGFRAPQAHTQQTKYYTKVTVGLDETLWDISGQYYSSEFGSMRAMIREVASLNHLDGSRIYYGQTLIIPYFAE